MTRSLAALLAGASLLVACGDDKPAPDATAPAAASAAVEIAAPAPRRLVTYTQEREPCDHYTEERLPLFGDLTWRIIDV